MLSILLFIEILPIAFLAPAPYLQLPMFISPKISPKPQYKFGQAQPIISSTALDTVSFSYFENSDSSSNKEGRSTILAKGGGQIWCSHSSERLEQLQKRLAGRLRKLT